MEMNTGHAAYDKAYKKYSEAFERFEAARQQYRRREINDSQFIEEKQAFEAAHSELDRVEEEMKKEIE